MFKAPNDINNLVHSKIKLIELKISGIQGARSLPFKVTGIRPMAPVQNRGPLEDI